MDFEILSQLSEKSLEIYSLQKKSREKTASARDLVKLSFLLKMISKNDYLDFLEMEKRIETMTFNF